MLTIPLPLAVAGVTLLLLLRLAADERPWRAPKLRFAALLAVCAIHGVLIGVLWGYGVAAAGLLVPITASLIPPLTWLAFQVLASPARPRAEQIAALVAPTLAVGGLLVVWRDPVDLILVLSFLIHGGLLVRLARAGPDRLRAARLDWSVPASRAAFWAGMALIVNGLGDVAVVLDYALSDGRQVPIILSVVSLLVLAALAGLAVLGTRASPDDAEDEEGAEARDGHAPSAGLAARSESEDDPAWEGVLARVEAALRDRQLFLDPDLTLARLARRAALPARDISGAINRVHGINVSQYVNRFRIEEACRLMRETDAPIGQIYLEAGFQTKSNFNREFRRQIGAPPSAWRAASTARAGAKDAGPRA